MAVLGRLAQPAAAAQTAFRQRVATGGAGANVRQTRPQQHRIGHLHATFRHTLLRLRLAVGAQIGLEFTAEGADVALAAVQNDFFRCGGDAAHRRSRLAAIGAKFHRHLKAIGQIAGIVPAIEGQSLHIDVDGHRIDLPHPCAGRGVDQLLVPLVEIHAQVLKAILIRTAVKHAPGVDADGILTNTVSFFCHFQLPHSGRSPSIK